MNIQATRFNYILTMGDIGGHGIPRTFCEDEPKFFSNLLKKKLIKRRKIIFTE